MQVSVHGFPQVTAFSIRTHLAFANAAWPAAVPSEQGEKELLAGRFFLLPGDMSPSQAKGTYVLRSQHRYTQLLRSSEIQQRQNVVSHLHFSSPPLKFLVELPALNPGCQVILLKLPICLIVGTLNHYWFGLNSEILTLSITFLLIGILGYNY